MDPALITLNQVQKRYSTLSSPRRRLVDLLLGRQPSRAFLALSPLDLEIRRGESLGLIGRNGAGKSTLLQILAGVISPTSGSLSIHCRTAAILDLGAGLATDLTGRENITLQGPLLGMSARTLAQRADEIIAFSELEEFIDQPVRTYSTGMVVRLGFSIATAVDPELLIIDEALSVGDGQFAKKSFNRIMELKARGASIVFCSHVLYQVEKLCDRVLWLERGEVRAVGSATDVIPEYAKFLETSAQPKQVLASQTSDSSSQNSKSFRSILVAIRTLKNDDPIPQDEIASFKSGEDSLKVQIQFKYDIRDPKPHLALVFHDSNRRVIASTSSERDEIHFVDSPSGNVACEVTFPCLPLLRDHYSIDILLLCDRGVQIIESVYDAVRFRVIQSHHEIGVVSLPRSWQVSGLDL